MTSRSGVLDCDASTAAGQSSAAAVPLVVSDHRRDARRLGHPEREERAGAFVEVHVHLDAVVAGHGERERC